MTDCNGATIGVGDVVEVLGVAAASISQAANWQRVPATWVAGLRGALKAKGA